MLITRYKDTVLNDLKEPILDKDTLVTYEDREVQKEIKYKIGFYCKICKPHEREDLRNAKTLMTHTRNAHKVQYCSYCMHEKPIFNFE